MTSDERSSCCTPSAHRERAVRKALAGSEAGNAGVPMVSLPGGVFRMGTDYEQGFPADGEGPVRLVPVAPFAIDTFPVTNASFAAFVEATGYRTEAEVFGWSFVFWAHIPPERFDELVQDTAAHTPWWCKVLGADWNHPEGPGSGVSDRLLYPVVHVSWNDASAYAAWAAKTLPSEAQWEYAARGGLDQKLYPWGDDLEPEGKHLCNIWQGDFPEKDTAQDGYAGICPVDAFPPNAYGIYSITGNVWEWCADWFHTGESKVMKGGSFLCHASYCNRYRVAARTSNTPDSSASNIGFRCAR